jgi:hypothetical protein
MESAVSIWIGLDGYTSEVIIQAGVDVIEDDDGDLTFKAWVEVGAGGPPLSTLSIFQEEFAATCHRSRSFFKLQVKSLLNTKTFIIAVVP